MNKIKQIEKKYQSSQVIDSPDVRDYKHEEIFGVQEARPSEYYTKLTAVLDQGNTMRCTLFSVDGAMTEQNAMEALEKGEADIYGPANPIRYLKQAKRAGFSEKFGWSIQGPLSLYKAMGSILGYGLIAKDVDAICSALLQYGTLCTGTNQLSWQATATDGIAKLGEGGGHAFYICGYSDIRRQFLIRNSWGANWGPFDGYFWLDYDMIYALFSCYVPYDISDAPMIYAYKAMRKGISTLPVKEFRPNDICTRSECANMIVRYKRVDVATIFTPIRLNDPITIYEVETMMKRAGCPIEQPKGDNTIKRWEVVQMLTSK